MDPEETSIHQESSVEPNDSVNLSDKRSTIISNDESRTISSNLNEKPLNQPMEDNAQEAQNLSSNKETHPDSMTSNVAHRAQPQPITSSEPRPENLTDEPAHSPAPIEAEQKPSPIPPAPEDHEQPKPSPVPIENTEPRPSPKPIQPATSPTPRENYEPAQSPISKRSQMAPPQTQTKQVYSPNKLT